MKDVIPINRNTGEIVDNVLIISREEQERRRTYYEQKVKWRVPLSSYFFYVHKMSRGFTELKPATSARLMYLATYLSYQDGMLYVSTRSPLVKSMLPDILNLKKDAVRAFMQETVAAGYVLPEGNNLRLSGDYFQRGEVDKDPSQRITKVFIDTVRDLYLKTPAESHSFLGYIFMMIPFVNVQWNTICHNPFEEDLSKVEPMSIGEFCDIIGYDKHNASRLIKKYYGIRFDVNGVKQRFCSFVYEENKTDMRIFINPSILYSGKNKNALEGMNLFF